MIGKTHLFGLALAAFGLFACNQADKSPVQADPHAAKGSARIVLPKLPAGYLAAPSQQAWFALTISGSGMAPMTRSWIVGPDAPPPLFIDSIPVGLRSFRGRLIRIDSSGKDTSVTHEGVDSAWIQRDSVAEVHLFLRQLGSLGSAHVCVEVEGWASDSSCITPPPPPPPPFPGSLSGCYALVVSKPSPVPGRDTLFKGALRLIQSDSLVQGTVSWSSGVSDTATGVYSRTGQVYLGIGRSDFSFQAQLDSTGRLTGYFYDSLRFIMGQAVATPGSCLPETTVVPPPPPAQRLCFAFTQSQSDGKTVNGRVGFDVHGDYANTYTHWDGYGAAAGVTSILMGSLDSTGFATWSFPPPSGMFPKSLKVDSSEYEVNFANGKGQGKIMKLNAPTRALGSWTGTLSGCLDSDFRL
ncbi:MAG: hypothetical protein JF616_20280 [Fibrobacteres bacterium]|nr:hypothetical protein [Fibrobacterota bacterium]